MQSELIAHSREDLMKVETGATSLDELTDKLNTRLQLADPDHS